MASVSMALCWLAVLLFVQPLVRGKYSRLVSYQNEIVVRCPDKNKATVQILRDHSDVWHTGKESIDVRIARKTFARVQEYFPECSIMVEDLEAHVQAAEARMFPQKKAEQEAWLQAVVQSVIPKGDLRECEAKIEEWQARFQRGKAWFDEYHSYTDTVNWYKGLADEFPKLVTFNPSIGKTQEGRDMPSVNFTGTEGAGKKKFYIQCQIHAREWISGATCMYIVDYFVQNYKKEAIITNLMDNLEFVLVPFVNPDGYVYTWTTDRMWRKNRNHVPPGSCVGVDINRNFPEGFKVKSDKCAEDYGGPHATSELETQHIINYFRANAPIVGSIDFHSYGELILRPWGLNDTSTPDDIFLTKVGKSMVDFIREVHGTKYTSEHSYELYYCYGIAADWFYGNDAASKNDGYRSASLCIELRDTADGHGFLLPADQIVPTAEEILPGVIHYMKAVMDNPLKFTSPVRSRSQSRSQSRFQSSYSDKHT